MYQCYQMKITFFVSLLHSNDNNIEYFQSPLIIFRYNLCPAVCLFVYRPVYVFSITPNAFNKDLLSFLFLHFIFFLKTGFQLLLFFADYSPFSIFYSLSSFSSFSFYMFVTLTVLFLFLGASIVCGYNNLKRTADLFLWFPDKTSVCTPHWHSVLKLPNVPTAVKALINLNLGLYLLQTLFWYTLK